MITNTGRKTRADAKLERLDEAQRGQLHFWFEENFVYLEIVKLVQQHFGLSVGKSTVAAYWKRHIMPQRQQDDAEEVAALAALPAGDFDAAILQRAKALAWDALARSHPDIDRAAKLLNIVRKAERHALALKWLELEERRVAVREQLADQRRTAPAKERSDAPREPENPPRSPGYSELLRSQAEARPNGVPPSPTPAPEGSSSHLPTATSAPSPTLAHPPTRATEPVPLTIPAGGTTLPSSSAFGGSAQSAAAGEQRKK